MSHWKFNRLTRSSFDYHIHSTYIMYNTPLQYAIQCTAVSNFNIVSTSQRRHEMQKK